MQDPLRLSELLCARMCHDLSGSLGSLLGGLELAAEQPEAAAEPMALAVEAAQVLAGRLRFLRAAWAGDGAPRSAADLRELTAGIGLGSRVQFDWAGFDPGGAFAPAAARVLLNVLLLATEAVAGPGRVAVAGAAEAEIVVAIEGRYAKWPPGLAAILNDEAAAWAALTDARSLLGPLAAILGRRAGLRLSLLLPTGTGPVPPLLLAPATQR